MPSAWIEVGQVRPSTTIMTMVTNPAMTVDEGGQAHGGGMMLRRSDTTMPEQTSTNVVATPMPMPFVTAVVTASGAQAQHLAQRGVLDEQALAEHGKRRGLWSMAAIMLLPSPSRLRRRQSLAGSGSIGFLMASFTAAKAALTDGGARDGIDVVDGHSAARPRNWSVKSGSCTSCPARLPVLSMPMTFAMVPRRRRPRPWELAGVSLRLRDDGVAQIVVGFPMSAVTLGTSQDSASKSVALG